MGAEYYIMHGNRYQHLKAGGDFQPVWHTNTTGNGCQHYSLFQNKANPRVLNLLSGVMNL